MKNSSKITISIFAFIAIALFVGSYFLDSDPPLQTAGWVRMFSVLLAAVNVLLFFCSKEAPSHGESKLSAKASIAPTH